MALEAVRAEKAVSQTTGMRVNWGGIFAGAFVTLGAGIVFLLLGNAVGLATANVVNPAVRGAMAPSTALVAWSWIYGLVTMLFCFYLGGYFASRIGQIENSQHGALYGLASWALATVAITAFGSLVSLTVQQTLLGIASNGANWLMFLTVAGGAFFAAMGGMSGRVPFSRYVTPADEGEERVRAA